MSLSRTQRLLFALVLALSLVATACGGEEGDDAAAEGGGAEGSDASDEPIVIGAALSVTGSLAASAVHQQRAYELWVEQTNASGGLLGRQVELLTYDDQSDPTTATRLYTRLLTQDDVDLVMGPFGSAASAATATVAEGEGVPMLMPLAASQSLFGRGYENVFQVITPATNYFTGAFELGQEEGYETVAYIGRDYEAARDIGASYESGGDVEEYGFELVHNEYWPEGTVDFTAVIQRLEELNPDMVICTCYVDEAIEITRGFQARNYMPKVWISNGAAQPDFTEALGDGADMMLASSQYEPGITTEGNPEFVAAYEEAYDYEPSYYSGFGYSGMEVLGAAVEAAGSLDPAAIRDEIATMTRDTVTGTFDVDETGAQLGSVALVVQIIDGERVVVWPEDFAESEVELPLPGSDGA